MPTVCHVCSGTDIEYDQARGDAVCTSCGSVLEDNIIVSEVTFSETGGASSVVGQFVSAEHSKSHVSGDGYHHGMGRDSRDITLQNAKRRITDLGQRLRLNQHCIDSAFMFFKMALQLNLTRGRKSNIIDTACLYLVCRSEGTPHLLLDFSDVLQINVYALGRAFLKLSNALHINPPAIDPCLYIHRFAHKLELGDKTHEVSMTALRLVARMKRDWIHHGRRPSGLCGAALLVAARIHNFSRSVREVARVVKLSGGTIRKRLTDFKDTPSSRLTIEEFLNVDLEQEHDPPCFTGGKKKSKSEGDSEKTHPLSVSNKSSAADKEKETDQDKEEEEIGGFGGIRLDSVQDIIAKARYDESFLKAGSSVDVGEDLDHLASLGDREVTPSLAEERDSEGEAVEEEPLDDLDDKELEEMILTPEEVEIKSKLWDAENGEFMKELELKRLRAQEEKQNKDKRKKQARNRKQRPTQQGSASNAGEAIERMIVEKRISSKINYDVLKDLADGISSDITSTEAAAQEAGESSTQSELEQAQSSNAGSIAIARSAESRGRLPSLSVRKRTFSTLDMSSSLGLDAKFPKLFGHSDAPKPGPKSRASKPKALPTRAAAKQTLRAREQDHHSEPDQLTAVLESNLEQLKGSVVAGEEPVVESGPVEYEGGLDDEDIEELAYEDDPLLHSDYEDDGEYYD